MKYLISGASGFIGSNLRKYLEENGHSVKSIKREWFNDIETLTKECLTYNPDYIIHLASYGNMAWQTEEDEIVSTNILKTYLLLKVTKDIPYKLFVNVSTSSVYGERVDAMREDMALHGKSFYAVTKIAGEGLCTAFAKKYDKNIISIRPFSIFGEYEDERRFIPVVIKSIKENKSFKLDENACHDWVYVKDFIDALMALIETKNSGVYNIGTGVQRTNLQVVNTISELMNRKAIYESVGNLRSGDSRYSWVADITQLKKINYKEKYGFEEGIKRTIKFYEK